MWIFYGNRKCNSNSMMFIKKNMDMIVANNVKVAGAGFGTDTNVVTIITGEDNIELPMMSKEDVASKILDFIMAKRR